MRVCIYFITALYVFSYTQFCLCFGLDKYIFFLVTTANSFSLLLHLKQR